MSKLYFSFNMNNFVLTENKQYYSSQLLGAAAPFRSQQTSTLMAGQIIPKMNIAGAGFSESRQPRNNANVGFQREIVGDLFGDESLEKVTLSECISVEGITD